MVNQDNCKVLTLKTGYTCNTCGQKLKSPDAVLELHIRGGKRSLCLMPESLPVAKRRHKEGEIMSLPAETICLQCASKLIDKGVVDEIQKDNKA